MVGSLELRLNFKIALMMITRISTTRNQLKENQ